MARRADDLGPDPIDLYVGLKLREARRARGCSQGNLAKAIGLTFQQVQKYENGSNRISSSMLVKSARFLGIPTSSLMPPDDAESARDSKALHLIATLRGSDELVQAYGRIRSARLRRHVVILTKALATEDDLDEAA